MSLPQYLIPGVVLVFVVFLALAFWIWYWRPSRRLLGTLNSVIPAIQALKPVADAGPVDRDQVAKILGVDATLTHLWSEYTETLHEQHRHEDGDRRLFAIRATVPAEVFFNTQVLVDTPLNTEFFRHLPGLLTGIGIIGTFSGLILGVSGFDPTGNADAIKTSMGELIKGVREAFYASAIAIGAAMLITFVEKSVLNRRYKQVEQLAQAIDALYEAGAGEEYLARLVKAAEESAIQTKQLKQSLVVDLKQILTDLSNSQIEADRRQMQAQIEASKQHTQQMATDISTALQTHLGGTAVTGMMTPVVDQFVQQIQSTFGTLTQQTTAALQDTLVALDATKQEISNLKVDIAGAGKKATEELTAKLKETLDAAEKRDGELRTLVESAVQSLNAQRAAGAKAEQTHLDEIAGKTKDFVTDLSAQTGNLTAEVLKAVHAMSTSIDKMNLGAQKMLDAATKFKDAGMAVTGVMQQGVSTMNELRDASTQVSSASKDLAGIMTNAQNAQQTMQGMVSALHGLIDQTKREAGVSKHIVDDMNKVAVTLTQVEQQTQKYLGEVNKVLTDTFNSFGNNVKASLETSTGAFQSELDKGVKILMAAFDELSVVVSQFPRTP